MLRIVLSPGSLVLEEALLGDLERRLPRDVSAMKQSGILRILVPSSTLRLHLLGRFAERFGAWAGVQVFTLAQMAEEVLASAQNAGIAGNWLLPVLCQRAVEATSQRGGSGQHPVSLRALEASVLDLLDAGFESVHLEPTLEVLEAVQRKITRPTPWARTVLECTAQVASWLEEHQLFVGAGRYRTAARVLRDRPELIEAAESWIHGFADATGGATDFLAELAGSSREARLYLDLPPVFPEGLRSLETERFGRAFRDRLRGCGTLETWEQTRTGQGPKVRLVRTANEQRELEWVAREIRNLLDSGIAPERIAVVARELGCYLQPLRRTFERWAIPYTVIGATAFHPRTLRLQPVQEWLERGGELPTSSLLELLAPFEQLGVPYRRAVLEARKAGWRHLEDVNKEPATESSEDQSARLLLSALKRAASALTQFASTPAKPRPLSSWLAQLKTALREGNFPNSLEQAVFEAVEEQLAYPLSELPLERSEFQLLFSRLLETAEGAPLGGDGGGVQVATVTAFRGQTTDFLYLLGLRHGLFPRIPREDPLLPDTLRIELQTLLPDLSLKLEGHEEERFLFDQLLSGVTEQVVALEPAASDAGNCYLPSPFRDRILIRDSFQAELCDQGVKIPTQPLHPLDLACEAGSQGELLSWSRWLPAARAAIRGSSPERHRKEARALLTWVRAREPRPRELSLRLLAPWLGFVGGPLPGPASVTALQSQLRCGWQAYLESRLKLAKPLPEGPPDPFEPRLLGDGFHRAMERLLTPFIPKRIELLEILQSPGQALPTLKEGSFKQAISEAVAEMVEEYGFRGWRLEPLLEQALGALVEQAWSLIGPDTQLLGIEINGTASWAERTPPLSVRFRVDRVDCNDQGQLVFVDYKTGAASKLKELFGSETSAFKATVRGLSLQAPVYLQALTTFGGGTALFQGISLNRMTDEEDVVLSTLEPESLKLLEPCGEVVQLAFEAREQGIFPPVLFESDRHTSNLACRTCSLLPGCLQDDGTVRTAVSRALRYLEEVEVPALNNDLRLLVELLERPRAAELLRVRLFSEVSKP